MNPLIEAHNDSKAYRLDLDLVKEAEVAESIHTGEWIVHQSYKVPQTFSSPITKSLYITEYSYFIYILKNNSYHRYLRCSLGSAFPQNSNSNPRKPRYPQLGKSNIPHHPNLLLQPTHSPSHPTFQVTQNAHIPPQTLSQSLIRLILYLTIFINHSLHTICDIPLIYVTIYLYSRISIVLNNSACKLYKNSTSFRPKMSTHPSPLTTFLDEFQQILTEITGTSFPYTGDFRKLHTNLRLLIATVRLELLQLEKIKNIMSSNSPAPVKLTKMYEEINILIVQVNYFTLRFTLKQLSAFILKKYKYSNRIKQLSSMHYYKTNKLNVISNFRTLRKNLSWNPVEPVRPLTRIYHHAHHASTLLHSNQTPNHLCTTVQPNISMFNVRNNRPPLSIVPTAFKEPSPTHITVNILFSTPAILNYLLKPYTNVSNMLYINNTSYAKNHVLKTVIILSSLKFPNCRIQRRASPNNTPEPSCSLQLSYTLPQPQVAKINPYQRLCLILHPSHYIRYPAFLPQQQLLEHSLTSPPYNPSSTTSSNTSTHFYNNSLILSIQILFFSNDRVISSLSK